MTFEPWSALSHDDVASSALRSRSVLGTQTKDKQTRYYSQLKGRQCSAPQCPRNTATTPFHNRTPETLLVSLTDHSFFLTAVHITPFSTSVFTAASPVYQQCSRILSCGSNITKDNNTRRKHAQQHDSVPPTVHSHQGQIRKNEQIPWDEIVVSSHYTDDVQLTDYVTDEFRFQHPSSS